MCTVMPEARHPARLHHPARLRHHAEAAHRPGTACLAPVTHLTGVTYATRVLTRFVAGWATERLTCSAVTRATSAPT
ncbi:hypothetical protein AB0E67_29030 [Streptomyces sp. NPDC032161]|uniref:hypothetical protein n=1 Tax=unclassified Streptomyces TaxID=2593676 RepID=UPI0034024F4C